MGNKYCIPLINEKNGLLFNNTLVGILVSRISDGKVISGNDYFAHVVGFKDIEELISSNYNVTDFYYDFNDRERLLNLLKTQDIVDDFRMKIAIDNEIKSAIISVQINRESQTLVTFAKDITEIERSISILEGNQEKLLKLKNIAEKSSNAKSTFLANMSHEFRTPMNSILGMTELLYKTNLSKKQFNFINVITKSAENLLVIINDILDISKIESGELVFDNISFRLKDTLADVVNSTFYRAKQKGIELKCNYLSYGGDGCILKGDPVRLNQIILNLVDNAVKFTDKGKVEIVITQIEETNKTYKIVISIEDTGVGIAPENIKSIFNSFSQGSTSSDKHHKGTGLGLTISKHLVSMLGGELKIESEVNIGSVFSFEIEYPKGNQTDLIVSKHKENEYDNLLNKNVKILLAEDEEFNQIVLKSIVEEWGLDIEVASNGEQALEMLSKQHFDIIFMDIQMPVLDGIEATKIIRNEFKSPINTIPIIAITANAYVEDHKKFYEIGIDSVISKPFKSQILFNKIVELLNVDNKKIQKNELNTKKIDVDKIYDLSIVKKIAKDNNSLLIKILTVFKEKTATETKELLNVVYNKDWEQASIIAHKLKPSVAYLGMSDIEKKLINIIEWGRAEENTNKIKMYAEFISEVLIKVNIKITEDINVLNE